MNAHGKPSIRVYKKIHNILRKYFNEIYLNEKKKLLKNHYQITLEYMTLSIEFGH